MFKKNFVFSQNPINTEAEQYHNPTPEYKGNIVYKSGNKKGQPTIKYNKWVNENKNKPDFIKPNLIGNTVTTTNNNKNIDLLKDKRSKKKIVLKKSLDVEFSKGVIRQKPNNIITFNYNINDNFSDKIYNYLKKKSGKFVIIWDGGNSEINLTGDWRNYDHSTIMNAVSISSDETYFNIENGLSNKTDWEIKILEFNNIKFKPIKNNQIYADNKNNTCIIDPILTHYEKQKTKTGALITKRLNNYIKKYPNGLDESQIQTLCNSIRIHVIIFHPVTGTKILDLKCSSPPIKVFKYVNSRINHAQSWDYNKFYDKAAKIIEVNTEEEMQKIFNSQKGEFLYLKSDLIQGKTKINYINTPTTHYKLINPVENIVNDFYNKYPELNNFLKSDVKDYDDVSHFINQATYVNGIHDFNLYESGPIFEHDINKAYATFYECKFYDEYKFPSTPSDFRNVKNQDIDIIINKTGWTQIYKIKGEGTVYELANLQEFGVYTNVELKCLMQFGITFKIIRSAWCINTHDFRFNEEMTQEINHPDYNKLKPYAIEAGKMLSFSKSKKVYYKYENEPTEEYLNNMSYYDSNLKHIYNNNVEKYMIIEQDKDIIYNRNHIGSYITAYVRCRMYEEVNKYKKEDIYFIRSDAIKLKGNYELPNGFKLKKDDIKLHENNYKCFYNSKVIQHEWNCGEYKELNDKVVYLGPGGTGKTYDFINDKGLVYKSIALPTNELKGSLETDIKKFTHYGICPLCIGIKNDKKIYSCNQEFNNINCSNVFIDEISMRNPDDIQRLLKIKNKRLIFAGDWNIKTGMVYQLQPVKQVFDYKLFENLQIINFTTNYRTKDKKLLKILNYIRCMMDENYIKNKLNYINGLFINMLKENIITPEEMFKKYEIDDICICSTNKKQIEYNKIFDDENKLIKKYKITNSNDNYIKGQFVQGQIDYKNKELAYATSVHAVQGKTFKNKLFFDLNNIFEYGMFYTAVSRLTNINNLYLIK